MRDFENILRKMAYLNSIFLFDESTYNYMVKYFETILRKLSDFTHQFKMFIQSFELK